MPPRSLDWVWGAVALACVVSGCSDDASGNGDIVGSGGSAGAGGSAEAGNEPDAFTPGSATFSAVFEEIIVGTGCNGGALCHGGEVGNLPMLDKQATYDALFNQPAMGTNLVPGAQMDCVDTGMLRVAPGDPDESLLIEKIEATDVSCGDPMPPVGMLSTAQIQQVREWISNGALND